jgi:hypothetical protein
MSVHECIFFHTHVVQMERERGRNCENEIGQGERQGQQHAPPSRTAGGDNGHGQEWMELDVGECMLELLMDMELDSFGQEKKTKKVKLMVAFQSLEVSLLDEDDDNNENENESNGTTDRLAG